MIIASSLLLSLELSWTSKDVLLFLVHCIMLLSNPAKSGKAKTLLTLPVATALQITFVNVPLAFVVFDSSEDSMEDSQFKGIRITAPGNRKIVVFGQHEEVASNDAYLALPIISRPAGASYEYIIASMQGDSGTNAQAKDSVALIIGTENDTTLILNPSAPISHPYAPAETNNIFFLVLLLDTVQ